MNKKVVLIGRFAYRIYEKDFEEALLKKGCEVFTFKLEKYFKSSFLGKIENHFTFIGPNANRAFKDLCYYLESVKPNFCFMWRLTLLNESMLLRLKSLFPKIIFVSYNNDNPFGAGYNDGNFYQRRLWRHFIKCIPYYDVNLVYRPSNIAQYQKEGSRYTELFPPSFVASNIPDFVLSPKFIYDVVFIGHFTQKRLTYINALLMQGIDVRIFGTNWDENVLSESYNYGRIEPIRGLKYFEVLARTKVALAFLSELNEDVYTRRSFEIPACGAVMLSERTLELSKLFEEGKEAEYFSSAKELIEKVNNLIKNDALIRKMRLAAHKRAYVGGYEIGDRISILLDYLCIIENRRL